MMIQTRRGLGESISLNPLSYLPPVLAYEGVKQTLEKRPDYCDYIPGSEWLFDACKVTSGTIEAQVALSKKENEYVCRNLTGTAKDSCMANAAKMTARTQDILTQDQENLVASGDPELASSYCQSEAATKYPTLSRMIGPRVICSMGMQPDGSLSEGLGWWIAAGVVGIGLLFVAAAKKS